MKNCFNKVLAVLLVLSMTLPVFGVNAAYVPEPSDNIEGWYMTPGAIATPTMKYDSEIKYSGTASINLKNNTLAGYGGYCRYNTQVGVKPGVTYKWGFMAKSKNTPFQVVRVSWRNQTSLNPAGETTYDWKPFEFVYTHATNTGVVDLTINCEGNANLWIDDMYCYECDEYGNKIGKNLVANPDCEPKNDKKGPIVNIQAGDGEKSPETVYNEMMESDVMTEESINKVMGAMNHIPIYKTEGFTIDGDMSDWDDYLPIQLPVLSSQVDTYEDYKSASIDSKAILKMAYNDENFYFIVEAEDDTHVYEDSSSYWTADSIQFMLSWLEENTNAEIGLVYNEKEDKTSFYAPALPDVDLQLMEVVTKRNDNKITYEARIPWFVHFVTKPDNAMKFDLLINDNDGIGREWAIEMAPGIGRHKSNVDYPILDFMDDKDSAWFSWIEGPNSVTVGEKAEYKMYVINYGETADFKIMQNGEEIKKATIEKGTGIRSSVELSWSEIGEEKVNFSIISGEDTNETSYDVKILPTTEMVEEGFETLKGYISEIQALISKCQLKNIPVDYELVDYTVLKSFVEIFERDLKNKTYDRFGYTMRTLTMNYNNAKEALTAYLAGERESIEAPKYVTSKVELDGYSFMADAYYKGKIERRPTFFVGYGHYQPVIDFMEDWNGLAMNTVQLDRGMSHCYVRNYGADGWGFRFNGGVNGNAERVEAEDGGHYLKLVNRSAKASSRYVSAFRSVDLKPNTEYEIGLKIKGTVKGTWYTVDNWNNRNYIKDSTYADWTEMTSEFKTGADVSNATFRMNLDNTSDICVDDMYVREKGSNVNVLYNGDMETKPQNDYQFTRVPEGLDYLLNGLKLAEENDVSVSVCLCTHYFLDYLYELYPEMRMRSGTFIKYDINHPAAKALVEDFLRMIIPAIKDYKCVNHVVLSNEGAFMSKFNDSYLPKWTEFLKNKYNNDIQALNKVYDMTYTAFEDVAFPKDNGYTRHFMDYKEFNDKIYNGWHQWMADIVHEMAPDMKVTSKPQLHTETLESDGIRGNLQQGRCYEMSAAWDDLNGTDGYFTAAMMLSTENGPRNPFETLFVYDFMTSVNKAPAVNTEDHLIANMSQQYNDHTAVGAETAIWQGIIHKKNLSDIWLWDYVERGAFIEGCYRYRPDCITRMSKTTLDANRLAYEITALQNHEPEVGLFYSTTGRIYNDLFMNVCNNSYIATVTAGQPVKVVTDSTMEEINKCKVVILPATYHVKPQLVDILEKYIENGGKVIMIGEDCIKYDDSQSGLNDPEKVKKIKDKSVIIPFEPDNRLMIKPDRLELSEIFEKEFDNADINTVKLIDVETGKRVELVEYMATEHNGKVIINACSYDPEITTKKICIEIDGVEVESSKELRSNQILNKEFEITFGLPVLIEAETSAEALEKLK